MQEVRQRGRPLALLDQFITDQQVPADLRNLEREIEIRRKLCAAFGAALSAGFTTLAALLLGLGTGLGAMLAMLLGG